MPRGRLTWVSRPLFVSKLGATIDTTLKICYNGLILDISRNKKKRAPRLRSGQGGKMNPEVKVPVAEQLNPAKKAESIQQEYAIAPDGTIVKQKELLENPENPTKQLS